MNGQLFFVIQISLGIYILHFLHTHRWFNITNIIPRSPDDGSLEPKRYNVDFTSHIYIYIYMQ